MTRKPRSHVKILIHLRKFFNHLIPLLLLCTLFTNNTSQRRKLRANKIINPSKEVHARIRTYIGKKKRKMSQFQRQSCGREREGGRGRGKGEGEGVGRLLYETNRKNVYYRITETITYQGKPTWKLFLTLKSHRRTKRVRGDYQSKAPNFSRDKALKLEPLQSESDQFLDDVCIIFQRLPVVWFS